MKVVVVTQQTFLELSILLGPQFKDGNENFASTCFDTMKGLLGK